MVNESLHLGRPATALTPSIDLTTVVTDRTVEFYRMMVLEEEVMDEGVDGV